MNNFLYYKFPQPQYLGAKYKHTNWICNHIPKNTFSVLDAFSGSQSVSYAFKQLSLEVHTNDFLKFNSIIGNAIMEKITKAIIWMQLQQQNIFLKKLI